VAVIAFKPGPGAFTLALWCDDVAEYDYLRGRAADGDLTYDDQPIRCLDDASDRAALFIRFTLAQPYVPPPTVLVFEDIEAAEGIGVIGFYVFEGGLYEAHHEGGGRLVLDRLYPVPPPSPYLGVDLEAAAG
jgi:hypothetical protein